MTFYLLWYITSNHNELKTLRVQEYNLEVDVNYCI